MPEITLPNDFTPRPYQRRYMKFYDGGGKRGVWVWHRRAGKDLVALNEAAKQSFERVGAYWHCLPTYRQAKKAIWDGFRSDGKRVIDTVFPPAIVKRKNESEMLVELKNGSIVQLVGSDTIDNLVGAGPVHVTFSEFSISKPRSWDLIRPMLAENGGSASFIFTPRGNNWAKRVYDAAGTLQGWHREVLTIHDTGALPASILDEERAAGMPEPLVRQEYLCDFTAALVGSVWGDLLEALEKREGISDFQHERDRVFVSFDLGFTDSTAMWWWRPKGNGVEFIDHYESHGKPLSHYFDELDKRQESMGYQYVKLWLPHDARARTLVSGTSILEQFLARYGGTMVAITPELSLLDGVQAVRWLLQRSDTRFHARCRDGVEALKQYHYEYDDERRTYTSKPEHDWSSHTSDCARYVAVASRSSELLSRKPDPKPAPVIKPASEHTLDDWFKAEERYRRRGL